MNSQKQKLNKRLIVVSNRLPIIIYKIEDTWQIKPGSGGLITALDPIQQRGRGQELDRGGSR